MVRDLVENVTLIAAALIFAASLLGLLIYTRFWEFAFSPV
jgi:hypothetical protein